MLLTDLADSAFWICELPIYTYTHAFAEFNSKIITRTPGYPDIREESLNIKCLRSGVNLGIPKSRRDRIYAQVEFLHALCRTPDVRWPVLRR